MECRVCVMACQGPRHKPESFSSAGYTVGLASRSNRDYTKAYKHFQVDFSKPETVPQLFKDVHANLWSSQRGGLQS